VETCSSLEANSPSATQEIPVVVWTPFEHVLQKMNAIHVPPDSFYYLSSKAQVFQVACFLQIYPPKLCAHLYIFSILYVPLVLHISFPFI
jgi:hypothetical protein